MKKDIISNFQKLLKSRELLLVVIALVLRVIPAIYTPFSADMRLYEMVGYPLLAGHSPYELRTDAYSYPPLWMWVEAGGVWLSEFFQMPFQIIIKMPLIISDGFIALLIYMLAKKYGHKSAFLLGLFYAINPVSIIITGFHGQFDTLMLLMILLAVYTFGWSKRWVSPLFLGISIALKSFPVLLLPFFLLHCGKDVDGKRRFLIISLAPLIILLLPFLISDFEGVKTVLFRYAGWPDHGWVAAFRAFFLLDENAIFTRFHIVDQLLAVSKMIFLFVYGWLVIFAWRSKKSVSLITHIATVFCLFLFLYGGISSQYLLWPVPFLILINLRHAFIYTFLGSLALLGFYSVFYPDVISWLVNALNVPLVGNIEFYRLATLLFWSYLGIVLFILLLPKLFSQEES